MFLISSSRVFYPTTDNSSYCGAGGAAFYQMQAYSFFTASDIRRKTDIEHLPECLDFVRALNPKRYKFNNSPESDRGVTHWGFVAQDVAEVMGPHEFFGGHDSDASGGNQAISYPELTAVLWKAVQELAAEVAALKGIAAGIP
jgi:hypothetical protein